MIIQSSLTSVVRKNQALNNQQSTNSQIRQYVFYLDLPNHDNPMKIILELQPSILVGQALIKALDLFKLQLQKQEKILLTNLQYFCPRLPKKNGKPKIDMPSLDGRQKMGDIKIGAVAVQIKNPEAIKSSVARLQSDLGIATEIGKDTYGKELPDESQLIQKQKQSDCFFSFC